MRTGWRYIKWYWWNGVNLKLKREHESNLEWKLYSRLLN